MVKQLFVVNKDTFAVSTTKVNEGELGFITQSVNGSTGAAEVAVSGVVGATPVHVACGNKTSVELKAGELTDVVSVPYSAGTSQVITVTFTNAATYAAADAEYFVKVMDVTLGTMAIPTKTFAVDYSATQATSLAALETLMDNEGLNPDSPFYGMTTDDTSNFVITVPLGKTYRVAATRGASIAYTTAPVYPVGTTAHVKALEAECLTWEGFTNKVLFPVIRPDSLVVAGTNYDLVYANFMLNKSVKDGSRTHGLEKIQLIFAIKDGQSTVTPAAVKAQLEKLYPGGLVAADLAAHEAETTTAHV